jgi:hypothetical protein
MINKRQLNQLIAEGRVELTQEWAVVRNDLTGAYGLEDEVGEWQPSSYDDPSMALVWAMARVGL